MQHIDYLYPTISVKKYDASLSIPKTPFKLSVSSTTSETKDLTPDRDGVTKDIQFTVPLAKIGLPIVTALNSKVLEKQNVNLTDFARDLGEGTATEVVENGLESLTETLSELASYGTVGVEAGVRFDLRLKKINGKWRMLYLRAMDAQAVKAGIPVSVPVATGVSVKAKVEASASRTDQKQMRLGSETLMLIKSRYTTWKEANALDSRWPAFTRRHEADFKRLLHGMTSPDSNVKAEAVEMLDKAEALNLLAPKNIDRATFERELTEAVERYGADESFENYQSALAKLTDLLEINSGVFAHEMGERIKAAKATARA